MGNKKWIQVSFVIGDRVKCKTSSLEGDVVQINIMSPRYATYLIETFNGDDLKTYTMADWQLEEVT